MKASLMLDLEKSGCMNDPSSRSNWIRKLVRIFTTKGWRVAALSVSIVFALLLGGCSAWSSASSTTGSELESEIVTIVDAYMRAMADKDAAQAYVLLSSRAQAVYSLADIEQLVRGSSYELYDGYQSSEVEKVVATKRLSTNPSVPSSSVQASGTVTYVGGMQGTFEAGLEQENGQWRLSKIWVVVPPEKFQVSPAAMGRDELST